ncbi:uncharacterized protein LOC120432406 [Culex pipiens pallens]|uniref:uncharacterized protein LOC120415826 n=1 Tax=Culex pipiens pallens TaxID=42434 RepID=UPI00195427C4|nr:uncharacterized protein LOC120415826 [Culex pipiens pallens]XP_039453543.1 uncharacterized protein LOC120432406 [Culex pipiens pallens]
MASGRAWSPGQLPTLMIKFLSGPIWKDAKELQMPYQVGGASEKQDLDAFNSGAMICVSPPAPVLHSPTLRNIPGSSGGEQTDPDQEEKNNNFFTRQVDRK